MDRELLVHHDNWVAKVHQLDDTVAVRHGIMVIGPAGGGTVVLVVALVALYRPQCRQARTSWNVTCIRACILDSFLLVWLKYNDEYDP